MIIKDIVNKIKEKELKRIEEKYIKSGSIKGIEDLIADKEPSLLFYIQIRIFGYLLKNDPDKTVSKLGVKIRNVIHPSIAKKSPEFLMNPQVIENRKFLLSEEQDIDKVPEDDSVVLPEKSVIWIQNHGFKDDALSSVSSIPRHTYLFFGSLPQFFNSIYGISAQLGGVVMTNRKVKESKTASIDKGVKVLEYGADLMICPEATWNKTPELLQLEYWDGFYHIAKKGGYQVVPIVHYLADPFERTNPIHTVIDDPIDISNYTKEEAKQLLRDKIATWEYLMMEKYGKSTREELLNSGDTKLSYDEYWEGFLEKLLSEVDYYDKEIETSCDYRDRKIIRPEDVYENIANIQNITSSNASHIAYAENLVRTRKKRDFQRRF